MHTEEPDWKDAITSFARIASEAMRPWIELQDEFERKYGPLLKAAAEGFDRFCRAFDKGQRIVDAIGKVGWLYYRGVPLHFIDECGEDSHRLDSLLSAFYRENWIEIRDDMVARLDGFTIDNETKAVFREALAAHEAELYRCSVRVLFPEIERLIRGDFVGKLDVFAALKALASAPDFEDMEFPGPFAFVLLSNIINHIYASITSETVRDRFKEHDIPNRHAVVHGLVPYSTHKHSMNTLILASFVFWLNSLPSSHLA